MHVRNTIIATLALAGLLACGDDSSTTAPPPPPPPPPPTVQLRDMVVDHLPNPYYHFEYDTEGRVSAVSFASGFTNYLVSYDNGRISRLTNNILVNKDRLNYFYDDAGRVEFVSIADSLGHVFETVELTYEGQQLTRLERSVRATGGFVVDKVLTFAYHADGNVFALTDHRPAIDGRQPESTTLDRFEQYDDGVNVEGFQLLHGDFFDHLVLLPGVQLQKGNPHRETFTSSQGPGFTADYSYTYDAQHRPLLKTGTATITGGPHNGEQFPTRSEFSYY